MSINYPPSMTSMFLQKSFALHKHQVTQSSLMCEDSLHWGEGCGNTELVIAMDGFDSGV